MRMKHSPDSKNNNNNPVYSLATCLVLAWRTLAKLQNRVIGNTSVVFKNVQFRKYVSEIDENQLEITILPSSGNFEICLDKELIVDGYIKLAHNVDSEKITLPFKSIGKHPLNDENIYKELSKRGYFHAESIKCIKSSDVAADVGYVTWKDWPSFINAILFFDILKKETRNLYLPKSIESIVIDANAHTVFVYSKSHVAVFNHKDIGVITAGGINIAGIKWNIIPRKVKQLEFEMYTLVNRMNKKVNEVKKQLNHVRLLSSPTGNLSSLHWVESPRLVVTSETELCHVYYCGLNQQDFECATGRELPDELNLEDRPLGIEFSGRTISGKRVMGIAQNALATSVLADKRFLWEVPSNWSLDKAATVPVAFATAYYALFVRGHLKPKQSVVVYHGCSDVGFAAIRLALHCGCKVFSTYETQNQMEIIWSRFLEVPDKMNGYHWDPTFEKKVLGYTNGKGADVILNLLGSDKTPVALSCLAQEGKLLDLECYGNNSKNNLLTLGTNKSYHSINMNTITDAEKRIVSDLLIEGIKTGDVYPIYSDRYSSTQIEQAFKRFGAVDRVGKIIVRIRQEETAEDKVKETTILASPQTYMDMEKSYILIGGTEDIVIDFCCWLISRGATKLVLVPKTDEVSSYHHWYINRWNERGITVIISTQDTSTDEGVKYLLKEASVLGSVGGIFHINTVFPDENVSGDLDETDFVTEIKILEDATQELIPKLGYFVIVTSKGDQATKDSLLNIIQKRKKNKLPGVIVHKESIESTKHNTAGERIADDTSLQSISYVIRDLDKVLVQPYDIVTVKPL